MTTKCENLKVWNYYRKKKGISKILIYFITMTKISGVNRTENN